MIRSLKLMQLMRKSDNLEKNGDPTIANELDTGNKRHSGGKTYLIRTKGWEICL